MLTRRIREFTISMSKINSFLIPNVSSLPSDTQKAEKSNALKQGEKSEFKGLIEEQLRHPRSLKRILVLRLMFLLMR